MFRKLIYHFSNIILSYFLIGSIVYTSVKGIGDFRVFKVITAPIAYFIDNTKVYFNEIESPNNETDSYLLDLNITGQLIHASQNSYDENGKHQIIKTYLHDGLFVDSLIFEIANTELLNLNPFNLTWNQDNANIRKNNRVRIKSVRWLEDSYFFNIKHGPLYCFSKGGKVKWLNTDFIFHHSLELDNDSNLWGCGLIPPNELKVKQQLDSYSSIPAVIVKVDPYTGKTLFSKGIDSIIDKTLKLKHVAKHEMNLIGRDLWHLNDVQPSRYNSNLIAISLRDINSIVIYDYVNDSIVYEHIKPSHQQHDIDFIDETTLAVYSNNTGSPSAVNTINRIDVSNGKVDTLAFPLFDSLNIYTSRQGLFEYHDSVLFVEETGKSMLHILNTTSNKVIGQYNFFNSKYPKRQGSWTQIIY